jgi:hypothetical protein
MAEYGLAAPCKRPRREICHTIVSIVCGHARMLAARRLWPGKGCQPQQLCPCQPPSSRVHGSALGQCWGVAFFPSEA